MISTTVPILFALIFCVPACARTFVSRELQHHQCEPEECGAALSGDGEKIREFINEGRLICTCVCGTNGTLLHQATASGCVVCTSLLLSSPSNCPVNSFTSNYDTPLHVAAARCQSPMTKFFLDRGARVNAKNMDDITPLCAAASYDSENCGGVIKDLVVKGGNICIRCNGLTPYQHAVNPVARDVLIQLGGHQC